jgi:hypothetical protein
LLFQDSEAYRLALKLYAGRYELIACRDAADILREAIEKHMPDSDRQTVSEEDNAEEQSSELEAGRDASAAHALNRKMVVIWIARPLIPGIRLTIPYRANGRRFEV